MNIEILANYADVIGGAAVIISLIYVGVQIRHSAKSSQCQTNQSAHEPLTTASMEVAKDEKFANLVSRGWSGLEQLTADEQFRFILLMASIYRRYENIYYQYHKRLLEAGLWEGYRQSMPNIFFTNGGQEFWKLRRHYFSESFQKLLDSSSRSDLK